MALDNANVTRRWLVPGDRHRNYFYLSHAPGDVMTDNPATAAVRLVPTGGGADVVVPATYADPLRANGALATWVVRCRIPDDTPAGAYTLTANGQATDHALVVRAKPADQTAVVVGPIPTWATTAAAALALGLPVRLLAGEYSLTAVLSLPAGATLTGHGATVVLSGNGRLGVPVGSSAAAGITVTGVTFESADPADPTPVVSAAGTPYPDLVFDRCVFRDTYFGGVGGAVRGCRLERTHLALDGADNPSGALVENCEFDGPNLLQSSPLVPGNWPNGGCGVVNCGFRATGRGVYVNTNFAAVRRFLLFHWRANSLHDGGNAGEAFLVEGTNPFDYSLNCWGVVADCPNTAVAIWECPAANNTVIKLHASGVAFGVVMNNLHGVQTKTRVIYSYLEGRNPAAIGAWSNSGADVDTEDRADPALDSVDWQGSQLVATRSDYPVRPFHQPSGRIIRVNGSWNRFDLDGDTGEIDAGSLTPTPTDQDPTA